MLLTIDIGNSHTVVGLFDADRLSGQWRFQSDRDRTDDELAVQLHGLLSLTGLDCHAITGVILVSVVPVLEKTWLSCCRKYLAAFLERPAQVVSAPWMQGHMTILTDHPGEVGADRLVNGIVAWQRYQCNLVIIDFGTAITFDCVSCGCEFLGGAILPGINISLEALTSRTAKLPRIDLSAGPDKIIGANTIQSMKSGILHGYAALVDGLTKKLLAEMGRPPEKPKVIATGGMAQLIAPYCQAIEVVDPNLTLKGLHYLYHTEAIHE